jgi:hypothetical protein
MVCGLCLIGGFTSSAVAQTTPDMWVSCTDSNYIRQTITGTVSGTPSSDGACAVTSTVTGFRNQKGSLTAVIATGGS